MRYLIVLCLFTFCGFRQKVPEEDTFFQELGYTRYEVMVLYLKYHESFREYWYPDGKAEAIGFGSNHWNNKTRKKFIKSYMVNGKMPYKNGLKLMLTDVTNTKSKQVTSAKKLAEQLHAYNTGSVKQVYNCCGGIIGCGSDNVDVRKAHAERRAFEKALWNEDYHYLNKELKKYKVKVSKLNSTYSY